MIFLAMKNEIFYFFFLRGIMGIKIYEFQLAASQIVKDLEGKFKFEVLIM